MDVSAYFQEGGITMYVILLLQFPAMFVGLGSLGYAWLKRYKARTGKSDWALPLLAIGLGILVLGIGMLGWKMGMAEAEQAIAAAEPEMARKLMRSAEKIASFPAIYGSIIGAPTMVAGVLAAFMVWRRPAD